MHANLVAAGRRLYLGRPLLKPAAVYSLTWCRPAVAVCSLLRLPASRASSFPHEVRFDIVLAFRMSIAHILVQAGVDRVAIVTY